MQTSTIKPVRLIMLLLGLLMAGCAGSQPISTTEVASEPAADEVPGLGISELPLPSEIKVPAEVTSEYLKLGIDYEQDLYHVNVTEEKGYLWLHTTDAPNDIAIALYWLKIPDYESERLIRAEWGKTHGNKYLGIANFSSNRWNWSTFFVNQYSEEHVKQGMVLVAVAVNGDDNLKWLIAGDLAPPVVKRVSPAVLSTGVQSEFYAKFVKDLPDQYHWTFSGGLSIESSTEEVPDVYVEGPGNYTGKLTVANSAGSSTYDFSYEILDQMTYEPLHLYAIPERTVCQVGEELIVTVYTGSIPELAPMDYAVIGINYPDSLHYVPGSLGTGEVSEDRWAADGFWVNQPDPDIWFIQPPDSLIQEEAIAGSERHMLILALSPVSSVDHYGEGALCNLKLKPTLAGEFSLSFSEFRKNQSTYGTFYYNNGGYGFWHDISNDGQPSITVLP